MPIRWRRWLKWLGLAAWLGANAWLWFLLPPQPRQVLPDDSMLTPDGRWAVTYTGGRLTVRNVVDGSKPCSRPYPAEPLGNPLAVSSDAHWLIAYDNVETTLIDLVTGETVARTPAVRQASYYERPAFAPDGRNAAWVVWSDDRWRGEYRVWDLSTGSERFALPGSRGPLAFSPDGSMVAVRYSEGGAPDSARIWDVPTGKLRVTFPGTRRDSHPYRLAFSPDGRRLLQLDEVGSGPPISKTVRVYDVSPERLLFQAAADDSLSMTWAADDELLLVRRLSTDQLSAEFWDATTGAVRGQIDLAVPGQMTGGTAVPGDGRTVVTYVATDPRGWVARVVRKLPESVAQFLGPPKVTTVLWDARTGSRLAEVRSKPGSVSFAPDSRTLVTLGHDNRWRVWDVPPARPWSLFAGLILFQAALAVPAVLAWRIRRRKVR
jgi:dipeptidyl aminopeptidase/acylaminoacyl peptidase